MNREYVQGTAGVKGAAEESWLWGGFSKRGGREGKRTWGQSQGKAR